MRHDQSLHDQNNVLYQDDNVLIVAPDWVQTGLQIIKSSIAKEIDLVITDRKSNEIIHKTTGNITLKELQLMARNEESNTNGKIQFNNYVGINENIVLSIKDLVRQCVVVGSDRTTHYGGYPTDTPRVPQNDRAFVCDLIALQFQNEYNSGRLVLIGDQLPKGLLDDFIYENVVGEKKLNRAQAANDRSGRFIFVNGVFFDQKAYIKFVANDILIAGLALNHCAREQLNFKFLKYGTGYFAGGFRSILESLIGKV